MKMNYDNWFYNQYQYLTGNRNGKETFNDTKWIEFINRYKSLVDLSSTLPEQQPFGVMGNEYGYDQLIQLLSRSNYTFEDLNESLISTFKYSLKNCMGVNMVNTHVVIFKTRNTDRKNVSSNGDYYTIEVPFDQMHFGGRDEFIRQKIHDIHTTENGKYIPFNEFISNDLDDILGFSFLCTVNGFICNDCKVAIDDKGFKFKIKWLYSSDVEFIIYKLDTCFVHDIEIDASEIAGQLISNDQLKSLTDEHGFGEYQCILNIYDESVKSSVPSVINFGTLNKMGLSIVNLQNKTLDMITRNKSSRVHVVIYVLKYFHEVPNLYPAINYYELIESGKVYTSKHDEVTTNEFDNITMTDGTYRNNLEVCTPPISLDRSSTASFKTIQSCLRLDSDMMTLNKKVQSLGLAVYNTDKDGTYVMSSIIQPLKELIPKLKSFYITYNEGCILTSLVSSKYVKQFDKFIRDLEATLVVAERVIHEVNPNYDEIAKYSIEQLSGNNYEIFVKNICSPFKNKKLETISVMKTLAPNWFMANEPTRFNRPVSPYCFMVLKYDQMENCWLLCDPTIKHFHGISNTFYIDSELTGKEIFKFFVFYSDTANPSEKNIDALDESQIVDFDLFVNEVDRHMGFVKYWNVENKLLKYSKILYNKYDQDTCIQVLSKMLKRKLVDDELMYQYPSDIDYELSAINQFNYKEYDDDSEYAPFALNFLFYTLNMMNYSVDKLQSYFVHCLTERRYNNRFIDLSLSKLIDKQKTQLINYSHFSKYPTNLDVDACSLPTTGYNAFSGYGGIVSNTGAQLESHPYACVHNVYNTEEKYPLINEDGTLSEEYFIKFDSLGTSGYTDYPYNHDVTVVKYMTKYLTALYAYISEFQTDYQTTFNKTWLCDMAIETVNTMIDDISHYVNNNPPCLQASQTIVESVITDNPFVAMMNQLKDLYNGCLYVPYQGATLSIYTIISELLTDLRFTYYMFGFDNFAMRSIRALYIHLKKINTPMNVYEFRRWISGIDYNLLLKMKYMLAKNRYSTISQNMFDRYATIIRTYVLQCHSLFDQITNTIDSMRDTFYTSHMEPIITYCLNIIDTYTFDMYTIDEVSITTTTQYPTKPYVVVVSVDMTDDHFKIPNEVDPQSTRSLLLSPISELDNGSYKITNLVGLCKYCIFDDSPMTNVSGVVKGIDGTTLGSVIFNMTFEKTSNTATVSNDIRLLNDLITTSLDFQHVHESFTVNRNGQVISNTRTPINYELYVGNHFKTLDSIHELINNEQSPIDRIYLPNHEINSMITQSMSNIGSYSVYFKPSQCIHLPMDANNVITSVGGKYKPGQRLYLYTKDLGFTFPVTVTTIDSNEAHGFVECKVDSYNSKWFKVDSYADIVKYFTTDIECSVVDDNISNFLDEFNDTTNIEYNIVELENAPDVDEYVLPGDPIFVTNNAPYVYTRLNYMFNETIPDRFIDDEHKLYTMNFIGDCNLYGENNTISINMISHDYLSLTENQLYTDLRGEPNDHEVYNEERRVFVQYLEAQQQNVVMYTQEADEWLQKMSEAQTIAEYQEYLLQYENATFKSSYAQDYANRLNRMIEEPESTSRWYNVRSYNAAAIYMNNGRGRLNTTYIPNVSYVQIVDSRNVYVYDWDNKYWISPEYYTVTVETVDGVNFGNKAPYLTDTSAYKMDIEFDISLMRSKRLLIYIGYDSSDLYDDIQLHDKTCYVRFKPLVTNVVSTVDPYADIKLRKHFDGLEAYVFDEPNTPDTFSDGDCYKITRYERNGNYQYTPSLRMCDLTVNNNGNDIPYTQFDLYVPNPFKDTNTDQQFKEIQYTVTIVQPIDNFVDGETVKLICVSNNELSSYNGIVSSVLFEGITTSNSITITESSVGYVDAGHYICTVLPAYDSAASGGLIDIEVSYNTTPVVDTNGAWIKIPDSLSTYREIPHEFIIKPKGSFDFTKKTKITFNTRYTKNINDVINEDNDASINNPFEYYHDTKNDVRLPISNTRHNDASERFVVDTTQNPDVKVIKTTYVSVCRYSLNDIPEDGIIDVTGFIPTPLSRKRYEFYVNGRIVNDSNVIILSPSSFQLVNLTSLKNFELIELVDDTYKSTTFARNSIYVSNTGRMFGSYRQMVLSNEDITTQTIRFVFNTDQQSSLYNYTVNKHPNNRNIESDILDDIVSTDSGNIPYGELYNIPSLNGTQLTHLTTKDFGLVEITNNEILDMFNKTWKREILTNPDFVTRHTINKDRTKMYLHTGNVADLFPDIANPEDWICIYATGDMDRYFTMYITNNQTGDIDNTTNTVKIIPYIKTGMYVLISSDYAGKWLHMTIPDTKFTAPNPIQL